MRKKTIKTERFECVQLVDRDTPAGSKVRRKPPHDWRRWPKPYRLVAEKAVRDKLAELPKGSKIIGNRSRSDVRPDLSCVPYQLYREIVVQITA